jgi:hypothetical protein
MLVSTRAAIEFFFVPIFLEEGTLLGANRPGLGSPGGRADSERLGWSPLQDVCQLYRAFACQDLGHNFRIADKP